MKGKPEVSGSKFSCVRHDYCNALAHTEYRGEYRGAVDKNHCAEDKVELCEGKKNSCCQGSDEVAEIVH